MLWEFLFQTSFLKSVPQKNLQFPPKWLPNCVMCTLDLFFGWYSELEIYHENFLLVDNKHRKLFVIQQSKKCKFMRKVHKSTFGGRAPEREGKEIPPKVKMSSGVI